MILTNFYLEIICHCSQEYYRQSFLYQVITHNILQLFHYLPDGFCLALSFLGTGTGIRRLLKAKCCCFFPPTGGGLAVQHERRITKGCRGSSAGGGGSVSGTAAPPAQSQSSFFSFFSHFMCCCGILAPRSRMGAEPPAWEALSLHHWTAREVPKGRF